MSKPKKKVIDFFYRIVFQDGDERKVPYVWADGEKKEYIKVCESVDGWGGIPLDVPWATSTNSYIATKNKLKNN